MRHPKMILNEKAMAEGEELEYITFRSGELFVSKLTYQGHEYTSDPFINKKLAEKDVAQKTLDRLDNLMIPTKITLTDKKEIIDINIIEMKNFDYRSINKTNIIIFDGDHMMGKLKNFTLSSDIAVIVVVGTDEKARLALSYNKGFLSIYPDKKGEYIKQMSDVYICTLVANLFTMNNDLKITIYSKDHFIAPLANLYPNLTLDS